MCTPNKKNNVFIIIIFIICYFASRKDTLKFSSTRKLRFPMFSE